MRLSVDPHTHTVASAHAYSTIDENAKAAVGRGIELLCITDHGPAMGDSPHEMHFMNYRVLPRQLYGVEMLYGAEVNIMDYNGRLDLSEKIISMMDVCIAGFHTVLLAPGSRAENTRAMLGAIQNPQVAAITHPEDGYIPIDFQAFVKEAVRCQVLVEVNNNSLKNADFRLNVRENLITLLKLCERYGAMVSLASDAHFAGAVGDFAMAQGLLQEMDFPPELVINTSPAAFKRHLESKG
jgi:putative hydrolase